MRTDGSFYCVVSSATFNGMRARKLAAQTSIPLFEIRRIAETIGLIINHRENPMEKITNLILSLCLLLALLALFKR